MVHWPFTVTLLSPEMTTTRMASASHIGASPVRASLGTEPSMWTLCRCRGRLRTGLQVGTPAWQGTKPAQWPVTTGTCHMDPYLPISPIVNFFLLQKDCLELLTLRTRLMGWSQNHDTSGHTAQGCVWSGHALHFSLCFSSLASLLKLSLLLLLEGIGNIVQP